MNTKQQQNISEIEIGMEVEATAADIGEADVSKPKVTEIVKNEAGEVEKVVVKKGVIFSKEVEIHVERIQEVEQTPGAATPNKMIITAQEHEVEALSATGTETLSAQVQSPPSEADPVDLMEQLSEAVPTAEGLRELERRNKQRKEAGGTAGAVKPKGLFGMLGPGFLAGMSGNDSSAVTTYSVDGATNGYGHLWLLLLATPLLQIILFACAKIGRVSQRGLAELLRQNYGRKAAVPAALILMVANIALIGSDLVAIGSGLELVTGLNWVWFVVPVAVGLWYVTVYQSFDAIKKIFLVMSLAFITYLITGFLAKPNWGEALANTFVPHLDFGFASISSAVGLLGATISPYTMFWQVQGEKEEQRAGTQNQQIRTAALDIGSGVLSGQLVAYFIIVCTATTLFTHHTQITTAADAAKSLEPLVGSFAKYLFAVGLIGAGMIAIPILLASTSYAISGTFGLPSSLSKKPWQNEGFYLILTIALIASLVIALFGFDPIQLMFWANVLQGTLAPILLVFIIVVGNSRKIMGTRRLGLPITSVLIFTALLLFTGTSLLFYGLLTGQGG